MLMANLAPIHGFTETVTVERATTVPGTAGGASRSWATHLANVKVRIQQISGTEAVQYGSDRSTRVYRVITEDADIVEGDRLNWTTKGKFLDITEIKDLQQQGNTLSMIAQEVST